MNKPFRFDTQNYIAAIFIILGVGFALQEVQVIDFGFFLSKLWPVAIILYGFILLINSRPQQRLWPLAVIAIGTLLTISTLNALPINLWQFFWPAILVIIGISIFRRTQFNQVTEQDYQPNTFMTEDRQKLSGQTLPSSPVNVIMGSKHLNISELDLQQDTTLDLTVVMGEFKLKIPDYARIINQTNVILGEFKDLSRVTDKKNKSVALTISGTILMGSIEVDN